MKLLCTGWATICFLFTLHRGFLLVDSFTCNNGRPLGKVNPVPSSRNVFFVDGTYALRTPSALLSSSGVVAVDESRGIVKKKIRSSKEPGKRKFSTTFLLKRLSSLATVLVALRPNVVRAVVEESQTVAKNTMVIGSLKMWLKSLFALRRESVVRGWNEMLRVWDLEVFAFLSFFSFATVPTVRFLRNKLGFGNKEDSDGSLSTKSSNFLTTGARLASSVYAVELLTEFLDGVVDHEVSLNGYVLTAKFFNSLPEVYTSIVFGYWFTLVAQSGFSALIDRSDVNNEDSQRNLLSVLYKRLFSVLSFQVYVYFVLKVASFDTKRVFNALVALGGVSSFVVGLALQEPAARLISGVALLLRGEFGSGETVEIDGDEYVVDSVGWQDTTLDPDGRGYSVQIPNDEMLKKEIVNLSRAETSCVSLKFRVRPGRGNTNYTRAINLEELKKDLLKRILDVVPKEDFNSCEVFFTDIQSFNNVSCEVECFLNMTLIDDKYDPLCEKIVIAINNSLESAVYSTMDLKKKKKQS